MIPFLIGAFVVGFLAGGVCIGCIALSLKRAERLATAPIGSHA